MKCSDHTLYAAAVPKNNQQRWALDSYLLKPDCANVSLSSLYSLSLCSCCRFWRRKESIPKGSCGFQDLSPESRYNTGIHTSFCHTKLPVHHIMFFTKIFPFWCLMFNLKKWVNVSWTKRQSNYWHCKMSEVLKQQWEKSKPFSEFNCSWHFKKIKIQWDKINNVFFSCCQIGLMMLYFIHNTQKIVNNLK